MNASQFSAAVVALHGLSIAPQALADAPTTTSSEGSLTQPSIDTASFERSWIEVPHNCKARHFNSEAERVDFRIQTLEIDVMNLYKEIDRLNKKLEDTTGE